MLSWPLWALLDVFAYEQITSASIWIADAQFEEQIDMNGQQATFASPESGRESLALDGGDASETNTRLVYKALA